MILLLLAGVVVAFVVWRGWGRPVLNRGQWRMGAALMCIGAFTAAALLAIRGAWEPAIVLGLIGGASMAAARSPRGNRGPGPKSPGESLSVHDARAVLGVSATASVQEIQAAYMRLMQSVHPDRGGTSGLAAQLNAARDRLLKP